MSTKMTRIDRVQAKLKQGMSHIEAEIAIVQEDAAAKVLQLKAKQDRENAKVQAVVAELLKEQHPDIYEALTEQAKRRLAEAARERSIRAKGAGAAAEVEQRELQPQH